MAPLSGKRPLLFVSACPVEQQDNFTVWASFLWHVRLDLKVTEGFAKRRHRHSSRSNRRRSVSTATESESMTVVVVVTTKIRSSGAKGLSSPKIETS